MSETLTLQLPEFSGYKVVKDNRISKLIDSAINKEWWNSEGWSDMYGIEFEQWVSELKKGGSGAWADGGEIPLESSIKKKYPKLIDVFNFLEDKFNYTPPYSKDDETKLESNTLYVGKFGYGFKDNDTGITIRVFPGDLEAIENGINDPAPVVKDIRDNGVIVFKTDWIKEEDREYPITLL